MTTFSFFFDKFKKKIKHKITYKLHFTVVSPSNNRLKDTIKNNFFKLI